MLDAPRLLDFFSELMARFDGDDRSDGVIVLDGPREGEAARVDPRFDGEKARLEEEPTGMGVRAELRFDMLVDLPADGIAMNTPKTIGMEGFFFGRLSRVL